MHALSFVHCNLVHMSNWIINGLPERFPKLKVLWIESGLAWIPYLMQRLDHEYQMRSCEAPLLKRLPSEYMREMFYTSQPMEKTNLKLLQATMEAFNAETQLLYASDWPHWDFDAPSAITKLPFLNEQAKRNILGLNAARLFGLEVPAGKSGKKAAAQPVAVPALERHRPVVVEAFEQRRALGVDQQSNAGRLDGNVVFFTAARDGHADPIHRFCRQAVRELLPGRARVHRAIKRRLPAAAVEPRDEVPGQGAARPLPGFPRARSRSGHALQADLPGRGSRAGGAAA